MSFAKSSSIYALAIGIMMLCMWAFFIIAGMVPEFNTKPAEITLHLVAEFATAGALILSGIIMLNKKPAGKWLYPLSTGMLLYTLVVSPGYYIQSGDYGFVIMFGVLIILSLVFLGIHLKHIKNNLFRMRGGNADD
jgi:xanthine/uracil/vitamin C permease (AzgA family)